MSRDTEEHTGGGSRRNLEAGTLVIGTAVIGTVVIGTSGRLEGRASAEAIAVLRALPDAERRVLELVSLAHMPIACADLRKAGGRLSPKLSKGDVDVAITALEEGGFLELVDDDDEQCVAYWRDLVAQLAVEEGRADNIARALRHRKRGHELREWGHLVDQRDARIQWMRGKKALHAPRGDGPWWQSESKASWLWDGVEPVALPPVGWLSDELQGQWVREVLHAALMSWRVTPAIRVALQWAGTTGQSTPQLRSMRNVDALLAGREPVTSARRDGWRAEAAAALQMFVGGEERLDNACKAFEAARKRYRKAEPHGGTDLPGLYALFHAFSLLGNNQHARLKRMAPRADTSFGTPLTQALWALRDLLVEPGPPQWNDERRWRVRNAYDHEDAFEALAASPEGRCPVHGSEIDDDAEPWPLLTQLLSAYWRCGSCDEERCAATAARLIELARDCEWSWLAQQCEALHAAITGTAGPHSMAGRSLLDLHTFTPRWQKSLQRLEHAADAIERKRAQTDTQELGAERLTWRVAVGRPHLSFQTYVQKLGRRGWSKGRSVERYDRSRLLGEPCCSPTDERLIQALGNHYDDDTEGSAARLLVGHPLVFDAAEPKRRVEVVAGEVSLQVAHPDEGGLSVTMNPTFDGQGVYLRWREGPQLVVYAGSPELQRIAGVLGPKGLRVPQQGMARARELLSRMALAVQVASDVPLEAEVEEVEGDQRLYLELTREARGLLVAASVRPLGNAGPKLHMGRGATAIIAEVKGRRVQARRSLERERATFAELVSRCPSLGGWEDAARPFHCATLGDSLSLLEDLTALAEDDRVILVWPPGEAPLRYRGELDGRALQVQAQSAEAWLAWSGVATIDGEQVARLVHLLDPARRVAERYVRLDDGSFAVLADALRKQLTHLSTFNVAGDEDVIRTHPAGVIVLRDLEQVMGELVADARAEERLALARRAAAATPEVPRTFSGELRSYQLGGYRWLSRLAQLGLGACLADDMGLGKTIQILALLLERAPAGPSLVVAPTSVCGNWMAEARRFAPTLRFIDFAATDRAAAIDELGPGDVLLMSYGLLWREQAALEAATFEIAVLDEAQAIKNHNAKRARAAFRLRAKSRIAATGTPIENRLGELFSVFHFLNPGLLGSIRSFNERFARPIEKLGKPKALETLRGLVTPFILRRTKGEVLDDLPPRTDVTLEVTPYTEEAELYEAIRLRALAALKAQRERPAHEQRFTILAELTRLRRACCHPSLVAPEDLPAPPGAKLDTVVELSTELALAQHRVLIFSQFVDVLALLREQLDEEGLSYQYLDGSTTPKQRTQRVNAFQAGEGDAFLISTKAGGFGLNLTGADYVIHVDPWWNPAVEDQASDRAHRIGQARPVTVYRLVMTGTVEESIVALHARKRNLATQILAGTDAPAALDIDELLALFAPA